VGLFTPAAARDQALQDTETVARVRGALEGYYTSTGAGAMVAVTHMLDLLNPRGMWSLDPQRRHGAGDPPEPEAADPDADPLTGCKPVSAPPK
jgi:hypothetical protein